MDDNVVTFPGQTTLDIPADKVLEAAVGQLDACMVVGIAKDGSLYLASSQGRVEWAHWALNNAVAKLCQMERRAKRW